MVLQAREGAGTLLKQLRSSLANRVGVASKDLDNAVAALLGRAPLAARFSGEGAGLAPGLASCAVEIKRRLRLAFKGMVFCSASSHGQALEGATCSQAGRYT